MSSVLALDVGDVRIGVAVANNEVRMPNPLVTLPNDDSFVTALQHIIAQEDVTQVVVGLPRDIQGNETEQTRRTVTFADSLAQQIVLPITLQDEALTSQKATEQLDAIGKPYSKGDIDALAACFILQDYLQEHA